jgi:hypothetical protein
MNSRFRSLILVLAVLLTGSMLAFAQEAAEKSALPSNVAAKLAFGKSVYIKNAHGGNIAFETIDSDIEGWGRFVLVDSPDKADFVVEINSYEAGSVSNTSHTDYNTHDGKPQSSAGASKSLSGASVTMTVYEPKTERELWSGTEKVKSALKKKAEEDNLVAAAEKLFLRFHDTVEPSGK